MRSPNKLAVGLLCFVLLGCGAVFLEDCPGACATLRELDCDAYREDCVEMCETVVAEPGQTLHTRCVRRAKTCEEAEECLTY